MFYAFCKRCCVSRESTNTIKNALVEEKGARYGGKRKREGACLTDGFSSRQQPFHRQRSIFPSCLPLPCARARDLNLSFVQASS